MFTRGECCVIGYRKKGEKKAPLRAVLVCSHKGDVLWATPVEKLVEWTAERDFCKILGIKMMVERPEPQKFLISGVTYEGVKVKNYKKYMGDKVAKMLKSKIASHSAVR